MLDAERGLAAAYKAQRDNLLAFIQNAPVESGVCCCGDSMDKHYSQDHSAVDMWDHSVLCYAEEFAKFDATQGTPTGMAESAPSSAETSDANEKQLVLDLCNIAVTFGGTSQLEARISRAVGQFLARRATAGTELTDEVIGCFRAAEVEGLAEALANTTDERLKDLVERRLMHALYAAERAQAGEKS